MSVFFTHMKEFNGFIKGYWAKREEYYWNRRMSPENRPFARYNGRHKRSGASYGCSLKQFDVNRQRVFRKFHSRKTIPYCYCMPNTVWWFGKGGTKQTFNTKFMY